ncbi:MAG TPA: endonuclease MutS2 [Clostridiales bacterium]|nr:endonuclease MutS2 [Clostridiales bacterium]
MDRNFKALELDKVLNMLAKETTCADAYEQALTITPSYGLYEVNLLLKETQDAHMLSGRFGSPSFGGIKNVTNSLRRAEAGGCLTMLELLRISEALRVIRSLKQWRQKSAGIETSLDTRFNCLIPNKFLEEKINSCILSEEEMADNASPALASIRKKIKQTSAKAREVLDKMIRSATYQKYLQDAIVTIRDGRFVVPVKSECRSEIAGLVHDTSSSGATVFIEPMGAVDANNEIKVLLSKEQAEIEKILYDLSIQAGTLGDEIINGYNTIIDLNVIFAKASLAYNMKASMPIMNDKGNIDLHKARHPLIDKNKVVPTSISLGVDFDSLVITGPNTGGKTVSLKTLGLLTLMAMCGMMIPAGDNSQLSVFHQILVDIGDEQSIEQSLSTFSSHMTNIIQILKCADQNSLVLIDELGAGTDPVEGAALAIAILEQLRSQGSLIASTTHYAELKEYALQSSRVENGCCEFDVATLRPTYKLLIGVPGRSNAFAISEHLGMEASLVDKARALVSSENRRFEDVVQTLEEQRQGLEEQLRNAESISTAAKKAKADALAELDRIKALSAQELKKAHEEAQRITAKARSQAYALMDEMDAAKKKNKMSAEDKAKLKAGIRSMENSADPVQQINQDNYTLPRKLRVGDNVLIFDIDKKATVLEEEKGGNVLVQAGIIKTRVPVKNLRLLKGTVQNPIKRSTTRNVKSKLNMRGVTEVDLRGQTALEATMELDRAIDSAILSGITQITVIHGKGTGVLRTEVQKFLKSHKSVKAYRLGTFGEGDAGVTIVELK